MVRLEKEYTREDLLHICENAFVDENQWCDRDSAEAQKQLGECYALLRAGCDFKVIREGKYCVTDNKTIWVDIFYKGFNSFEGGDKSDESYYLPTFERINEYGMGKDWY